MQLSAAGEPGNSTKKDIYPDIACYRIFDCERECFSGGSWLTPAALSVIVCCKENVVYYRIEAYRELRHRDEGAKVAKNGVKVTKSGVTLLYVRSDFCCVVRFLEDK